VLHRREGEYSKLVAVKGPPPTVVSIPVPLTDLKDGCAIARLPELEEPSPERIQYFEEEFQWGRVPLLL